jgi:hypothetical protein
MKNQYKFKEITMKETMKYPYTEAYSAEVQAAKDAYLSNVRVGNANLAKSVYHERINKAKARYLELSKATTPKVASGVSPEGGVGAEEVNLRRAIFGGSPFLIGRNGISLERLKELFLRRKR